MATRRAAEGTLAESERGWGSTSKRQAGAEEKRKKKAGTFLVMVRAGRMRLRRDWKSGAAEEKKGGGFPFWVTHPALACTDRSTLNLKREGG